MPVDIEVCEVAVHSLADEVGHPTDSKDVSAAIQREAVFEAQALA
jgi:hypothetical protein